MLKITLTAARVNAGFTLDEVAEHLHKTKSTIIAWEKGKTNIKVQDFDSLCNLYRISKDYIILPSTLQKVEEQEDIWKKEFWKLRTPHITKGEKMDVEKIYSILVSIIAQKNNVAIKTDFKRKKGFTEVNYEKGGNNNAN